MTREVLKALFSFAPDPDRTRDKSGSSHQSITDAALKLAEHIADHVEDGDVRETVISTLAAAVKVAHHAIEGPIVRPVVETAAPAPEPVADAAAAPADPVE